jgi:DNA-binding Lrp family transcriptional regulator
MDLIDKKMLYELDKDSRMSFIKLAKILRISPERTRYRFNTLKDKGIIKYCLATVNSAALGYLVFELFIKLQNVNQTIKDSMIKELSKSSKVAWLGDFEGNFDLGIIFLTENQLDLYELILDFDNKYSQYIMKKSLSINLEGEFLKRDYLISNERKEIKSQTYKHNKKLIKIDSLYSELCRLIAKDSRITALEMSKILNVSVDTIITRLRNLEKNVITGYNIVIDNSKINQMHYKILIYLNDKSSKDKFVSYCKMNNRIISIVKTLAEWDYEIDIEVENVMQLKSFTMDLTRLFSKNIRDYDILRVVDMPKYTLYP